jgi:O-antigen/teichoic acid export membrane protein
MSVAKRLASQTAVYGVSSIVGRVLTYLLVPVYTRVFGRAEYGVVTELYAYVAFLNIVFTYGIETAYFRFANRAGADRQLLYDRVLSLLLLTSLVLSGVLALLARPLAELLRYPGQSSYIVWLAIILGLDAVVALPFARLRLENKARKFAAVRLVNIVVNVGLNLFFVKLCPEVLAGKILPALRPLVEAIYDPTLGVGYVFLVNLIANALYIPLLARELFGIRFRWPDREELRPLLVYAYPLMFMGLAGMVNEVLDRIVLKYWLPTGFYPGLTNEEAVGVYGACYKLSILMSLVIQAFRYAADPFFFSQSADKNSPATFALVLKWFVSLNLEDFGLMIGPAFRQGLAVVPVLLMANLFFGMFSNLSVWFKLTDKTYYGTYIGAGGAVLTVALNLLLIPLLGYMGCAITTLVCYFTMAMVCWRLGQRHFPVPYPMGRLGLWLLFAVALVALGQWVPVAGWWARHAFHVGLAVLFLAALYSVERPRRALQ